MQKLCKVRFEPDISVVWTHWLKEVVCRVKLVVYNRVSPFPNSREMQFVKWWELASNNLTCSTNDPAENDLWLCQDTLNHRPVEPQQQFLTVMEVSQPSQEKQSLLRFKVKSAINIHISNLMIIKHQAILNIALVQLRSHWWLWSTLTSFVLLTFNSKSYTQHQSTTDCTSLRYVVS